MMLAAQNSVVLPLLGIGAKSSNALVKKPKPQTAMESKKMRYALQRTAQTLLYDKAALKQHRTCGCHRNILSAIGEGQVGVYQRADRVRFGNLVSCGSVWSCPVCAAKVTESRREDMQKAQSAWLVQGGSCLLMTLTHPHEVDLPLAEHLTKQSKALDYFKNSRTYKRIFGTATASIEQRIKLNKPLKTVKQGQFQRLGTVRSLEVTHGVNGWHPHCHEVLFMGDDAILKSDIVKEELAACWVGCLLKAGLGDNSKVNEMLEYAFDLRGGDYVSDYINKFGREPLEIRGWTIAHEVTKGHSKQARKVGKEWHYTPFQLLAFATDGDHAAAELFKEFSANFEGKRMNYWTNGLKDWFGLNDEDDEELAAESAEPEPKETLVFMLQRTDWQQILRTESRAECLQAAKDGVIVKFLESLASRPRTHSSVYFNKSRLYENSLNKTH
jgi:hypothetical protein